MTTETPQDMYNKPGQIIGWFDDLGTGNEEFNFLSNFYEGEPFSVPGWVDLYGVHHIWATGEHAYQAMKTHLGDERQAIANAVSPGEAKALGQTCTLRVEWETVKYDVMAAVLRSKFTMAREEGPRLLQTGDALLVEGTYWHDEVWGVDLTKGGSGRNWLGTLLMARRAELRAEVLFGVMINSRLDNAEFANIRRNQ